MKISVPFYSQYIDVTDERWQAESCMIVCLKMALDALVKKEGRVDTVSTQQSPQSQTEKVYTNVLKNIGVKDTYDLPSIDALLTEGEAIGGFSEHGWIHAKVVALARNHGFHAYNQEFKSIRVSALEKLFEESSYAERIQREGLQKMCQTLHAGYPVIASIVTDRNTYHAILLVGFEEERGVLKGFYYHDSSKKSKEDGGYRYIDIGLFTDIWRKFAIFVFSKAI